MNINLGIANRALEKAGQEALTSQDIEKDSSVWRLIKSFYLSTLLETLANTPWTSQKKRKVLNYSEQDNYSEYDYVYDLPIDCAKPEEIQNNDVFIVEGDLLYTNTENAVLLYISNGKKEIEEEKPEEDSTYDMTETLPEEEPEQIKEDDYPEYEELKLDPLLSEYVETRLASKIALKLTDDRQLYQLLFNESSLIEQKAIKMTLEHAHSKQNGNKWWDEQLGLGGVYADD